MFRVAGVYAVVAWVIIQIGEATFGALNLPPWALTFIIILLFTGFPIAIIFSWIFDRTPEGTIQIDEQDQNMKPMEKKKRTWLALGGIAAGIILGILFAWVYSSNTVDKSGINDKSIAVLPFTAFSTEEEDLFFADGIHDDILTQLAKITDIKVISRTSVMEYKNTTKKIKEIAKELNVKHILEGSVRRSGNKIRIISQLINADTDEHLWGETYDRDYADIFAIQSDVAKKIATALKATLTPEEIVYIEEKPTENMEAYDYFLKGKYFWNTKTDHAGIQKAADMFDKATELDPYFTLAYVWASITHSRLFSVLEWDHTQARKELAKRALDKALALDPDHPKVRYAKGIYQDWCLKDITSALREYEIALKGEPNNQDITASLGVIYFKMGNWKKAEETILKAYELNPVGLTSAAYVGIYYLLQRQFDKADYYFSLGIRSNPEQEQYYYLKTHNYLLGYGDIKKARSLLKEAEINVPYPERLAYAQFLTEICARNFSKALGFAKEYKKEKPGFIFVGSTYFYMGEEKLAKEEFESLRVYYENKINEEPENAQYHSNLGQVYAYLGLKEKAINEGKRGTDLLPIAKDHADGPLYLENLSIIYILTGEYELALENIEYLLSHPGGLTKWTLRLYPVFDPLRDDPRFQKLIADG